MKSWFKLSVVLAVLVLFAASAFAQSWTMPSKGTAVPCSTCVSDAKDKLTYPYNDPLVRHVGRYVDSSTTGNYQNSGMRTIRARGIRVYPQQNRVLVWLGDTIGLYRLDTLFGTRLSNPLVAVNKAFQIRPTNGWDRLGNPFEKVAPPDQYFYCEAKDSEWVVGHHDIQRMLNDFDMDDRGYIYAASTSFGWGISRDDGLTDASHVSYVTQVTDSPFTAAALFSIRSGSKYYVVLTDKMSKMRIHDVTTPLVIPRPSPGWVPPVTASRTSKADGFLYWAKHESSQRLAVANADNKVRVYDYATYVNGGSPLHTYSATRGVVDIDFDESGRLWIAEKSEKMARLAPAGNGGYSETVYSFAESFSPDAINAAGGYVSLVGSTAAGSDVLLLKVEASGPQKIDLDDFFRKYYTTPPTGYVAMTFRSPSAYDPRDVEIVEQGNKTFLMFSAGGLGDVYEIQAGDSISVSQGSGPYGTANPNAASTESGPFYGDILKFRATTNSASNYSINWNFGNTASGASNTATSALNQDVSHQFTGYDTPGTIAAAKTVTAEVASDASISNSASVSLKVPTARIAIPGITAPMTQATKSTFNVVLGDKFNDASDGVIEGHFAEWTIDNNSTKLQPNESIDVGALGTHSLAMVANYGKYNPSTFTVTGAPFKATINNLTYHVKPFIATIRPPVTSGTNYVFNADPRWTRVPAALNATTWTVTWSLVNDTSTNGNLGSEAEFATQAETVAVGTIPSFSVPKTPSPDGKIVKLQITVDAGAVAPGYTSFSTQQSLSIPNIAIAKTAGCTNAGEPCTLTASAATGTTAGWQLAWTIKRGNTTVKTGSGLSVTFTPNEPGAYVATAHETAYNVSVDSNFTVAATVCSPVPEVVTISLDCSTNCVAGTPIQFEPSIFPTRNEPCDQFTWDFGDNTGSNVRVPPPHTYTTNRSYTVKLTIKNNNSTRGTGTWTRTITLGGGGGGGDDTCVAPVGISITYSGNRGCSASVPCQVGEEVTFTARRVGGASLLSCDAVAWTVDGEPASTPTPQIKTMRQTFTATGNKAVAVTVSNQMGVSPQALVNLNIVPSTATCATGPTAANIGIDFTGLDSQCTPLGGPCRIGETMTFVATAIGYTYQSCDRFEWNFGDNTPVASQRQLTHVYNGARNSATVTLKVYSTSNPTGVTVTRTITFGTINEEPAPVLGYANFPTSGAKGVPVTFSVNSTIDATAWSWDFNDGSAIDNSQASVVGRNTSISHTFTKTGTFNVRVTAKRSSGATLVGQTIGTITISEMPQYRYLLPVVTHIGGQGGSVWRTDVQIYNPDPNVSPTKPLVMTATLRDMNRTLEIFDSTYIYEDFMNRFTNGSDSGPVIITTNAQYAPQIWTRTYNQTEEGTFGQFIPAIRLDAAGGGSAGETGKYYLAGLRANVRYRTNLGLVNPTTAALPVTINVYDDAGLKVGTFNRTVQSFQLLQFNIAEGVSNLSPDRPFSVELSVPDNQRLVAYASYIDGGSNDPVFMQAVRESELSSTDFRTGILPGVGHVGAWRSDVTIFNPNSRTVAVDMAYYDASGAKKGEASSVPVRAGEFLQYDDILKQGVFGNVADGLGMLRVTVPASVDATVFPMLFARTYNDEGTGKTYGQGIRGFAAAQANVKAGKPALIPGVRNNSKYQTNIGLSNVTDATVTVTIKILDRTNGQVIRDSAVTLKPFESTVLPGVSLEGRENASVRIEANGNVWAFASIIDKGTKDPEYVSAIPLQ